jgi:hypothetical protein
MWESLVHLTGTRRCQDKGKEMKLWERVEDSAIIDRKPLRLPNNKNGR